MLRTLSSMKPYNIHPQYSPGHDQYGLVFQTKGYLPETFIPCPPEEEFTYLEVEVYTGLPRLVRSTFKDGWVFRIKSKVHPLTTTQSQLQDNGGEIFIQKTFKAQILYKTPQVYTYKTNPPSLYMWWDILGYTEYDDLLIDITPLFGHPYSLRFTSQDVVIIQ